MIVQITKTITSPYYKQSFISCVESKTHSYRIPVKTNSALCHMLQDINDRSIDTKTPKVKEKSD